MQNGEPVPNFLSVIFRSEHGLVPIVYGFDTGFVCAHRGWHELRREDLGRLWEHWVLNELQARLQTRAIHYWRDKRGHEVDFVLLRRSQEPLAVECKWSARDFEPRGLQAFARQYPQAVCVVAATDAKPSFHQIFDDLRVAFTDLEGLLQQVA